MLQRKFSGENIVSLTNCALTAGYPYAKKPTLIHSSHHIQKFISKWITELNIKPKIIKLQKQTWEKVFVT